MENGEHEERWSALRHRGRERTTASSDDVTVRTALRQTIQALRLGSGLCTAVTTAEKDGQAGTGQHKGQGAS